MNKIPIIIPIVICIFSCFKPQECNVIEQKIIEICVEADSVYTIPLASLTDFKWDVLYVIGGPTIDDEVEEFIGVSYKEVIQDGNRQYIFIKDGKIVKEYSSGCSFNLTKYPSYNIGDKYFSTSLIQVQMKKEKGYFTYKIIAHR